ncbi:hypothetical protein, partial [Bradyrhizobium sp.]|uniref:hypothetical protein n=1 Tax=Bradyrhizobium sp. TaxID=376 RepID=UPI003C547468
TDFIESVAIGGGRKHGINDWQSAIEFWAQYNEGTIVDLITADIRFTADKTTPLLFDPSFRKGEDTQPSGEFLIPTGLSHLKPFAAVARAGGRPLGIAIHTADVHGWKTRLTSSNIPGRLMAYLAAHEVGEVAAILGHRLGVVDKTNEEVLEACWAWLSNNTCGTFGEAWPRALRSYREHLVRHAFKAKALVQKGSAGSGDLGSGFVMVLPNEWTRLAAWCEQMAHAKDDAVLGKHDPGFAFLLSDRSRESISFRSLFADSHMSLPASVDLQSDPLPSRCFKLEPASSSFALDEEGYPKIGAFLMEFGEPAEAYRMALEALDAFPVDIRASLKLGEVLTSEKCGSLFRLARLFAILFQLVRRDRSIVEAWEGAYERDGWDLAEARFRSEPIATDAPSLRQVVLAVSECIRGFDDGITIEAVLANWQPSARTNPRDKCSRRTIEVSLRILESLGVVFFREEDREFDVNEWRPLANVVPPVPGVLPDGLIEEGDVRSQDAGPFLRDVFGYGGATPNDNQIGRFIAEALGLETRMGREFLADFRDGTAPTWIKEICREYATSKLLWPRSDSWPRALK